jgi:hypothetical protein
VENGVFEKLQGTIETALERFAALKNEKKRLEELSVEHELENMQLKKRLESAMKERKSLKQRLTKVMERIDSLKL